MTSQELVEAIKEAGYEAGPYYVDYYLGGNVGDKPCVSVSLDDNTSVWKFAYDMGRRHGNVVEAFPVPRMIGLGYYPVLLWDNHKWH